MKVLACNCLNVTIETVPEANFVASATSLDLKKDEAGDVFFEQDDLQVGRLSRISKENEYLVESRVIGSWTIYHCLNCYVQTHAVHREKGPGAAVFNSKLLDASEIAQLKHSNLLSKVYNIIVNHNLEDMTYRQYDYLSAEVELMLECMSKRANDWIKHEDLASKERIKQFTEREFVALQEFKERTARDQKALKRVILSHKLSVPTPSTKTESSISISPLKHLTANVPDQNKMYSNPVVKQLQNIMDTNIMQTPEKRLQKRLSQKNSFDSEGLFSLDGMDDNDSYPNTDGEISDVEDHDEDKSYRQQTKAAQHFMAKSLPMNIPVFLSSSNGHEDEQEQTEVVEPNPEETMDIAASMKALAKSLHGDTVFGDLPRPRCRTNI